jgi:hypothetical protein
MKKITVERVEVKILQKNPDLLNVRILKMKNPDLLNVLETNIIV